MCVIWSLCVSLFLTLMSNVLAVRLARVVVLSRAVGGLYRLCEPAQALQRSPKQAAKRPRTTEWVCAKTYIKKQPENAFACVSGWLCNSPGRTDGRRISRIRPHAPFSCANFIHMKPHSLLGPHPCNECHCPLRQGNIWDGNREKAR